MSEAAQAWATHCMTYVHQLLSIEDPATTFLTTEWLVKAKHVFPFDAGLHTAMTPAMEEWLEQPEQQEARNLWGSPTVKVYVRPRLPRPPALPAQAPCPQPEGVGSDELTRLRRDYPNIFKDQSEEHDDAADAGGAAQGQQPEEGQPNSDAQDKDAQDQAAQAEGVHDGAEQEQAGAEQEQAGAKQEQAGAGQEQDGALLAQDRAAQGSSSV